MCHCFTDRAWRCGIGGNERLAEPIATANRGGASVATWWCWRARANATAVSVDIQEISATQFNVYPSQILYILELKARGVDALKKATTKINTDFDRIIKQTLQLLAPPGTKQMVVDVACLLAITHATQKESNIINTFISEEKKTCRRNCEERREIKGRHVSQFIQERPSIIKSKYWAEQSRNPKHYWFKYVIDDIWWAGWV